LAAFDADFDVFVAQELLPKEVDRPLHYNQVGSMQAVNSGTGMRENINQPSGRVMVHSRIQETQDDRIDPIGAV
jgi:hypothetical protein